jgi:transposase
MDGVVEIITGRERRRRWSVDEKLRIVAETRAVGGQVRAVAARNGLCESLLYTWRRQVREGVLLAPETPMFMPVRTLEATNSAAPQPADPERMIKPQASAAGSASHAGMIEIELGDGRRVRVGNDVNLAALRRVLQALQS